MPSHSPYALSNLTLVKLILICFWNYIRIRDSLVYLKLKFTLAFVMLGKTFSFSTIIFDNLSIIGVFAIRFFFSKESNLPLFSLSSFVITLFSFQGTTY